MAWLSLVSVSSLQEVLVGEVLSAVSNLTECKNKTAGNLGAKKEVLGY